MFPYKKSKEDVLKNLSVSPDLGLSSGQASENIKKYGKNEFAAAKKQSFLGRLFDAAKEPMLIVLIIAAIIAVSVNITKYYSGGEPDFFECAGILFAILLSIIITVLMEGRSARAFELLNSMKDDVCSKAIRDGKIQYINKKDLAVGDIILIETGDKIPSDGRLIEASSLYADESALTGESEPVLKDENIIFDSKPPVAERKNMLYSGTFITAGSGKMVICDVGGNTEFGKIAAELSRENKSSTPLQEKLTALGKKITVIGASAAALVFIIRVCSVIIGKSASFGSISEAFLESIVLIVAAVPEGLPTIVAVSLAINVIKMSRENALVKKLAASETVGEISVICSDKTGTLTQNRMTVTDIYYDGSAKKPETLENSRLINNFALNGTAEAEEDKASVGGIKFIGNPTECALLAALYKANVSYKELRKNSNIIYAYPFSSETKNMTSVTNENGGLVAYTKGSPEKILSMCENEDKPLIEREIEKFQKQAYRVIGFAHKDIKENISDFGSEREKIEKDMIFDGFVAIIDPLREEAYSAVEQCRMAGIDIKMLTGDNITTAKAIAGQLGLLDNAHTAVEASELEKLSDRDFEHILQKIRVIARSTPLIKTRVVNALKKLGNVVAVTGDGINDAPALKNADVGVAMGITGTEVSKEASDIILLDDSFSTIVKAVRWGRGIYENFQRFIQFQLTVNLSSVIVILISTIFTADSPFTALQILWVNLIMDGPPALTLGLEPNSDKLLERKPTARSASVVTGVMLRNIIVNGLFISAVILSQSAFNFLGAKNGEANTVLFALFVVFQLFNAFNSREISNAGIIKNFAANKLMLFVFALTFLLQIIIVQYGGSFFDTAPLSLIMWLKIILTALTVIALSEILKIFYRAFARRAGS